MYQFILILNIEKYYCGKFLLIFKILLIFFYLKFSGQWFEIAKNPTLLLGSTKCNKINIKMNKTFYNIKTSYIQTYYKSYLIVLQSMAISKSHKFGLIGL